MKQLIVTSLLCVCLITIFGQNEKSLVVDGNVAVRSVKNFTGIEVSGAIDLFISQGNEEAVAVSASTDEIRDRIKTELSNGILRIYFDSKGINWKRWSNNKMKAYVTYKVLDKLEASGACNVKTADPIKQKELKIEMSGASDFLGEVVIGKLTIGASGASNIKISGTAENTFLEVHGACNIKGYDLKTDMCKVDASGASNVRITVNKELDAHASGGSSVYFKGAGLVRDISSSGGASVKRINNE